MGSSVNSYFASLASYWPVLGTSELLAESQPVNNIPIDKADTVNKQTILDFIKNTPLYIPIAVLVI